MERLFTNWPVTFEVLQAPRRDRQVAPAFVLDDQVGGIRCDDAILAGQLGDFVAEFLVLAMQPAFIEQVTDPLGRPQPRNEGIAAGLVWEV